MTPPKELAMTVKNKHKTLARERMRQTGESYTVALKAVAAAEQTPPPQDAPKADK